YECCDLRYNDWPEGRFGPHDLGGRGVPSERQPGRWCAVASGGAEISLGSEFIKVTNALEAIEVKRVWDAVGQFQADITHPSLRFHPVQGDPSGRLYTFRASDELRVLVAREGNVCVLLEAGHHDAIYERAARMRFI